MCYDIKASLEAQLKRAKRRGDKESVEQIRTTLIPLTDLPLYHASGFTHPSILIYTDRSFDYPEVATWGLVPFWVKDKAGLQNLWNKTLNARGETIFDKPSFRDSARKRRCLIYVDGFYEHHHFKGSTYPFYISLHNDEPMCLAGLWSEWWDEEKGKWLTTFTIVTTAANALLGRIHNNPRLKEPRMPLVLTVENAEKWLHHGDDPLEQKLLQELILPLSGDRFKAHTVKPLRGKAYPGNNEGISDIYLYPELEQPLF